MRSFKIAIPLLFPLLLSACSSDDESSACIGAEVTSERLFLQQVSSTSAIIKWRGDANAVCVGDDMDNLATKVDATETSGNHKEALVTGLMPDQTYYYSVGGAMTAPDGQSFRTSPEKGQLPSDGNTRIWIVGDSGSSTDEDSSHAGEAAQVRDGMRKFVANNGGEAVDMFLMLGDNAYLNGSDANYQQGVFDLYTDEIKKLAMWSAIGNHEMGTFNFDYCQLRDINNEPIEQIREACAADDNTGEVFFKNPGVSTSSDPNSYLDSADDTTPSTMPYLDIYSFPTAAEVGGVASGTEQYFSFDQGNVHVVSLDSQLTARDETQRETMRQWLIDDLSANTLDWTIVLIHHPPYSKGANHDSDDTENNLVDRPIWDIRNEFVPVFDHYGVDLVYSGHAHSYERSHYLHNHTGTSDTYSASTHAELISDASRAATGRGAESYAQLSPTSGGIDNRVVYTVNGSSGKANSGGGTITTEEEWLRHPAHVMQPADTATPKKHGLGLLGSVVIDATDKKLTANFVDVNGVSLDTFSITR